MPLTEDFTYMLGDAGVILNTDSIASPFVDIRSVQGLGSAEFRTTERDHEGSDGSFMDAEFEKGRTVILEGTAYADGSEAESFLDALKANYAPSRTLVPFYFKKPGVAERLLWVKPLGCRFDTNELRRIGATAVQFQMFAEDPRIYSSTLLEQTISQQATSVTGRGYNRAYNYDYGAFVVIPDQINLQVGGNRPTPAVLTINGLADEPEIINDTLGLTMKFGFTVPALNTLDIDTYYHTVRLNNVANRRKTLLEPNWFMLQPGDNFLRYRSASTAGTSTLRIRWRDAWR